MNLAEERLPLSYAQQRLWFLDQLQGSSVEYNIPEALRLSGKLDVEALRGTINTIVERHESLRTCFEEIDGEPVQMIAPELEIGVEVEDLSALEGEQRRAAVQAAVRREAEQGFDLRRGPLLRMRVLRLGAEEHILLRTTHHIVSDGWSQGVFNREFQTLYGAYAGGEENPLPPLEVQYGDFTLWQRRRLEGEAMEAGLQYWKEALAGIPERLELPADRVRPPVQSFAAEVCQSRLSGEQLQSLQRLSRQNQATLYMTLLAGFALLLNRYSGQEDIVIGSPVANRQDPQLENLIGFFVNSLVMRVRVDAGATVEHLLAAVRHTALEAYRHQDVPFERLVELLAPQRSLDATPIYQVSFAVHGSLWEPLAIGSLRTEIVKPDRLLVRHDMELHAVERGGEMEIYWLYKRDLFDRWRMEQMSGHFVRLLDEMSAHPAVPLRKLQMLEEGERERIVRRWNDTARPTPVSTLPRLFEAQVHHSPKAIALVCEDLSLTYGQLNDHANRLAHSLIAKGIGPENVVAIAMPRCMEMIVAVLGILKAGAAYLPLDPDYPSDRLAFMLHDAGASLVLTASGGFLLPGGLQHVVVDLSASAPADNPTDRDRRSPLLSAHPAYIIYTSGSTGSPKGVVVTNENVARLLQKTREYFDFGPHDVWTLFHSYAFDFSVWEIWGALLHGGQLVVVSYLVTRSPSDFLRLLADTGVTVLNQTPLAFDQLATVDAGRKLALRYVIFGGENLDFAGLQNWFGRHGDGPLLVNMYGITETTVHVTYTPIQPGMAHLGAKSLIGRAIPDLRVYLLDANLIPVPAGVPGELYVAGPGLARGYMKQPALTAERFVANPFGPPSSRMYKSGDMACWRDDGVMEYLGRSDQQVKIRGFRVDPGEIESIAQSVPGVSQAVVVARKTGDSRELAAYVVAAPEKTVNVAELQQYLREKLPDYMVPGSVMVLERLPLTRHGKVDRAALPEPERVRAAGVQGAPRTAEEEILCGLFAEVLGVPGVGIEDDFFQLGGHSLMATRLVSRIRTTLGREVPIRRIFESPRVRELSGWLQQAGGGAPPVKAEARPARLPLSYAQQRLWFLDQLQGSSVEYNIPEALRLSGKLDVEALRGTINTIVERHESLRTCFEEIDGEPVQMIAPELEIGVEVEDLSALEGEQRRAAVQAAVRREAEQGFDLRRGPLLRMRVLRLGAEEHILLRTTHHIVSDGWSQGVFNREFQTLYGAYAGGEENPLPPLEVQYGDFTLWQRRRLEGEAMEAGLQYWKEALAGIPERLELPADRVRPPVQSFAAEVCQSRLSGEQLQSLQRLSRQNQATLYMTLLAGFALLLNRYSGQEDIVIESPVANRQDPQLENLIGFFVNSLVMRVRVDAGATVEHLLAAVRHTALEAYRHQDVPFERLVEALGRSRAGEAPFDAVFDFQSQAVEPNSLVGLDVQLMRGHQLLVQRDLELHAVERGGEMEIYWLYKRDLFDRWRMEQMSGHFVRLLDEMSAHPAVPLRKLQMLEEGERERIVRRWNDTARPTPVSTLPRLFEAQVHHSPKAIALVCEDLSLTYGQLNDHANRLAHSLIAKAIGPENVVAIAMPRCMEMIVAVLGILKAGAAYLPLDPDYPSDRLAFMLHDAGASLVLTASGGSLLPGGLQHVVVDLSASAPADNPTDRDRRSPLLSAHPAYIIYTSGSTGSPKGVVVTNAGIPSLAASQADCLGINIASRILQYAPLTFDAAFWEILMALANGAALILIRTEERYGTSLIDSIAARSVTHATLPPVAFSGIDAPADGPPATLVFAGEACGSGLIEKWGGSRRVFNAYGPTEATVCVTMTGTLAGSGNPPIGKPIANTRTYVLDGCLRPVPAGVAGELYVAGPGLARGYLGQPAPTAERFLADPFGKGSLIYRTGDLARWRANGDLDFLGRCDRQVKVRGYRVELAEVEDALRRQPGVRDAAVIRAGDSCDIGSLVAYVVPSAPPSLDTAAVSDGLSKTLPRWMQPAAILEIAALPVTSSGKVDYRALSSVAVQTECGLSGAPRTPSEEALAELFAEVLGVERVGRDDDFFALGGHSLLAVSLAARVRSTFGVQLKIGTFFEARTVAALAKHLGSGSSAGPELARASSAVIPLSLAQRRLWLLYRMNPESPAYNVPLRIRLRGPLSLDPLQRALSVIVQRHQALRTSFEPAGDEAIQRIGEAPRIRLKPEDLRSLSTSRQAVELEKYAAEETSRPFDLICGPLMRLRFVTLGAEEHVLFVTMHHIGTDGSSMNIFMRELAALYAAFERLGISPLPELPVQYSDYALWQQRWIAEGTLDQQVAYWARQMEGAQLDIALPGRRSRAAHSRPGPAAAVGFRFSPQLSQDLGRIAQQAGATLFMTCLALFNLLLHRYTSETDMAVGAPSANRVHDQIEGVIGFFVNTLILRTDCSGDPSFRDLLKRVRQTTLAAYSHADLPLEMLSKSGHSGPWSPGNPFVNTMFSLTHPQPQTIEAGPVVMEWSELASAEAKFELSLSMLKTKEDIRGVFLFDADLFEAAAIERMAGHFETLAQAAVAEPDRPVSMLPLLTSSEWDQMIDQWNCDSDLHLHAVN